MISSKIFIKYAFLFMFALFSLTFIRGIEARAETFNSATGTLTFENTDAFKKVFDASNNASHQQNTKEIIFKAPNFTSLRGVGKTDSEDGTKDTEVFNGFGAFVNLEKVRFETLKAVGNSVFSGCKKLKEINIGSTLDIGAYTFANCGFEEFNFTNIKSIEEGAFANCESLNQIVSFGEITAIPRRAFANCGFNEFNFTNINSIGEEAFANCEKLNKIVDFGNITTIPRGAFMNCGFVELSFDGKNAPIISERSFSSNLKLLSIVLGGNLVIKSEAFKSCEILKGVTFKNFDTAMGANLFTECDKLESVTFEGTSKIGRGLFLNCKSLKSVDLNGVQSIGTDAFRGCINLGSDNNAVNIPESVKYIGDRAFYGTGVKTVEFNHNSDKGIAFGIEIIKSGKTKTNLNDKIIIKCYANSYPMAYFKGYPDSVEDFNIVSLK